MLIRARLLDIKNVERGKETTQLVLLWLLEFRVAALDVLAARIGLSPQQATRLFKRLLARNIIERVKVLFSDKRNLVILGAQGYKMLETSNIDYATELTRVRRYTQKKTIQHDLEVQKAALKMLPGTLEIISEFNIRVKEKKPDLLVLRWNEATERGASIAVEMEKSGKSSDARFWVFKKYRELLGQQVFDEVRFFFSNEENMRDYIASFEKEEWPSTVQKEIRTKKGTKTVPATGFIFVKKGDSIRDRFSFELLKPDEPPAIFPLKEAAKLARYYETPYLERLKEQELAPLRDAAQAEEKRRDEKAARLLAQQAEQQKVRQRELDAMRVAEQNRVKVRDEKLAWFKAELAQALIDDNSARAWLPGYKFRHGDLQTQLCEYLQEQLAIESKKHLA